MYDYDALVGDTERLERFLLWPTARRRSRTPEQSFFPKRSPRGLIILFVLAMLSQGPLTTAVISAEARPISEAAQLYSAGRFVDSAALAIRSKTSKSLNLAFQAFLALAACKVSAKECVLLFDHAATAAREALELDPKNGQSLRYLAIALGNISRGKSLVSAFFEGDADEAQDLIHRGMFLEPNSPWDYSLLAAWHMEIVRRAGPSLAEAFYGASIDEAKTKFDRAVALAPDNPIIRLEFAKKLIQLNLPGSRTDARRHLSAAVLAQSKACLSG